MKPPGLPDDGGSPSRSAPEIAPQRIVPSRHVDVVGVQAVRRQNGIRGASGWAREFGWGHGCDRGRKAGFAEDFGGKLVPRRAAGDGEVHDPSSGRTAELHRSGRQIVRERWAATLIAYY